VAGAVTQPVERDAAVVAGGPTEAAPTTLESPGTVVAEPSTTSATVPAVTTSAPPTTTAPARPAFTMTPTAPVSSSAGDHYVLSGNGCTGQRVTLRVHGGQLHGDLADFATPAADGTWGIGFMVALPGTYEMRAACTTADWVPLFEYAPVPFTILP
jgi:hypothetical protein